MPSLSDVALTTIKGEGATLADYRGRVLLIVNVASKCGLTPQYTGLEDLYSQYKDQGLVVLGFPANDFAGQEPGSNDEIAQFCSTEYPVSFPMFAKIVVTGPEKHPLYRELIHAEPTRIANNDELRSHLAEYAEENNLPGPNELPEILWNFEKFVVDREGNVIARFNPDVTAEDPQLVAAVERALSQAQ